MLHHLSAAAAALAATVMLAASAAFAEQPPLAQAGKKHFIRCVACHSMSAEAPPKLGPHLEGIVGREVASVEGFNYSDALRVQGFTWDEAQLDKWLTSPQADIPGLCLPFTGLAKAEERRAFIAYLKHPAP